MPSIASLSSKVSSYYKSEHITIDKKTEAHDLDKLSFTFIDLPKFDKQRGQAIADLTLEEKFYYFLHHASTMDEESLQALIGDDMVIENAFKELERYAWSDEELRRDAVAAHSFVAAKPGKRSLRRGGAHVELLL